jgi:hypothetical protein
MGVPKNNVRMLLYLSMCLLLLVSSSQLCWSAGSMGADAYEIPKDVLDGGIQEIASDAYSVWSSVGQPVISNMQGGEYVLMGGFWAAFTYFVAGDCSNDETVDIADVIYLINYLFIGGSPPAALPSGDVNCDGSIDSGDLVYLMNYLFLGSSAPLMCDP